MLVKTAASLCGLFVAMDGANCHDGYSAIQSSDSLHQVNKESTTPGGTLIFSSYVGSGPAPTVHPQKISEITSTPKKYLKF